MKEIIKGVANMYNANIELDYKDGYPPTINHINQSETVLEAAKIVVGDKAGSPSFQWVEKISPTIYKSTRTCFFFVGSAPDKQKLFETPHHCSHFDMDERALLVGPSIYLNIIDKVLGNQ